MTTTEKLQALHEQGVLDDPTLQQLAVLSKRVPLSAMQINYIKTRISGLKVKPRQIEKKRESKNKKHRVIVEGLYPFQQEGVSFVEEKNGRALIADEMGLGKTVQALGYLLAHPQMRPAVIVCPGCVKFNWARETERWVGCDIEILEGRDGEKLDNKNAIYIVNYEILRNQREKVKVGTKPNGKDVFNYKTVRKSGWVDYLREIKPQCVIIDECHKLADWNAYQTRDVDSLCKNIPHVIGLSGTPIKKRPMQFYTILRIIEPNLFPNRMDFGKRFCAGKHNGFGWDFKGSSNLKELNSILKQTVMIRRTKKEVLPDLPDKTRIIVPIALPTRCSYWAIERDFIAWLKKNGANRQKLKGAQRAKALVELSLLKQAVIKDKLNACIEWIENYLETESKIVVGTWHKETVKLLQTYFKKRCVIITGDVSNKAKDKAVEEFQLNPKIEVLIGNLQSASVGLTMTAACATVAIEIGEPVDHLQFEDRVYRIGQTKDCFAYYLVAANTIEEKRMNQINEAMKVITQTVDGQEVPMWEEDFIRLV